MVQDPTPPPFWPWGQELSPHFSLLYEATQAEHFQMWMWAVGAQVQPTCPGMGNQGGGTIHSLSSIHLFYAHPVRWVPPSAPPYTQGN